MNKRSTITLFSLLALIAAFGLTFAGCDTPVQEVEGTVGIKTNKAPAPSGFTVTKDGSNNITIKFDLVDNAVEYAMYVRKAGTNQMRQVFLQTLTTSPTTVDNTVTCVVAAANVSGDLGIATGNWKIGIQTQKLVTGGFMDLPSDIVWKDLTY